MNPEKFAFAVGVAVFAGGSLGLILHRVLPEKHLTGGPNDMIGAIVGLLTLLSALVLGLLIWTAYGVYAGQNAAIQTLAAKVLQLDFALRRLRARGKGRPNANSTRSRQDHRRDLGFNKESDANFVANNFAAALQNLRSGDPSPGGAPPNDGR